MNLSPSQDIPVVVIGRNEGERLKICLQSVVPRAGVVVYVDSGSTDGSVAFARSMGCHVVILDPSRPFGPSRARNEGFAAASALALGAPFVQFLDGDCELMNGWLEAGAGALHARPDVAAVCGNVCEMFPDATAYNKLCDLEWHKPAGEIDACAGRFMVRADLFRAVGGFRTDVVAAEDDEFCIRLRRAGRKILQVDAPMARHDVAMTRFAQWWRRSRRTGFAYAQVAALHGGGPERTFVRECRSTWFWGLLPVAALALAPFTHGISLGLLAGSVLLFARIYRAGLRRGWSSRDARIYAWFTTLAKFPGLQGMLEFQWWRLHGHKAAVSDQYYDYKVIE